MQCTLIPSFTKSIASDLVRPMTAPLKLGNSMKKFNHFEWNLIKIRERSSLFDIALGFLTKLWPLHWPLYACLAASTGLSFHSLKYSAAFQGTWENKPRISPFLEIISSPLEFSHLKPNKTVKSRVATLYMTFERILEDFKVSYLAKTQVCPIVFAQVPIITVIWDTLFINA